MIQTVPMAGAAGDSYVMTLLGSGSGLTVGEAMTVTLESMAGGTVADSRTCTIRFASTTLAGARRCELATTAAHDDIRVTVGWDGATTGSIALDALSLTRREAVSLTLK